MESVPVWCEDHNMEILTTVGAIVTGLLTVIVGAFSLVTIWFEDLV